MTLAAEELLSVELTARTSAGFSWHVEALDESVLGPIVREHESAPGLGGSESALDLRATRS